MRKLDDLKLHVGCGKNKQEGWTGLDRQKIEGVDIVHDPVQFPWPLGDSTCHMALISFHLERIPPESVIPTFDELWRVLKPGGQALVATHFAGSAQSYTDPTYYRHGFTPQSFNYFDPQQKEYEIYKPKPWMVVSVQYDISSVVNVVMETMKRPVGKPTKIRGEVNVRV